MSSDVLVFKTVFTSLSIFSPTFAIRWMKTTICGGEREVLINNHRGACLKMVCGEDLPYCTLLCNL